MENKKKTSRVSSNDQNFHKYETKLRRSSTGLEAIHTIENDIARSVTELEELWDRWDYKIFVSVSAEKKRTWKKYADFDVSYDQEVAQKRFWQLVRSSLRTIYPKVTEEELSKQQYLVSHYDGNVYRVEYNLEEGIFRLEYFLLDTLYKDEYRLVNTKKGYKLYLFKWMKFPIPIKEFSLVAEQAKRIVNRQWKDIVKIIERGLREAREDEGK